jgi:hypothetical protein
MAATITEKCVGFAKLEEMIKMKNVEGQRMDGRLAMTIAHMAFGQAS